MNTRKTDTAQLKSDVKSLVEFDLTDCPDSKLLGRFNPGFRSLLDDHVPPTTRRATDRSSACHRPVLSVSPTGPQRVTDRPSACHRPALSLSPTGPQRPGRREGRKARTSEDRASVEEITFDCSGRYSLSSKLLTVPAFVPPKDNTTASKFPTVRLPKKSILSPISCLVSRRRRLSRVIFLVTSCLTGSVNSSTTKVRV